tara:strand:- start:1582 stop:1935 length:354 start_codon:yes stop_codon:yes gene_type:complete
MNNLHGKLKSAVETIGSGESIDFDVSDRRDEWPEAYSFLTVWCARNPCGVSISINADETVITLTKEECSSPAPLAVEAKITEIEADVICEPSQEVEEDCTAPVLKKPWWGNNQWNND